MSTMQCDAVQPRDATYVLQSVPAYRGNPLIEALPPIMEDDAAVAEALSNDIIFDEETRAQPGRLRMHIVSRIRDFWLPQLPHFRLEQRISLLIREGYQHRNPRQVATWCGIAASARDKIAGFDGTSATQRGPDVATQAHSVGMAVYGLSGVGKTTSIRRVLSGYPQRIRHAEATRSHPVIDQLVWLLVTCPGDGGMPSLCRAILAAFDRVMGTSHAELFTRRGASADAMRQAVIALAHSHALGLLVIDEIQLLRSAKSGNAQSVMGFLLALMNDLRVPVLVVGTQEAVGVLSGKFQNGRRFIGAGGIAMDRMRPDEEFSSFVSLLWERTILREMPEFDRLDAAERDALLDCVYQCTAGVHDLTVKLFLLANLYALDDGVERLTPEIFRRVYVEEFIPMHPFIDRMRRGGDIDPDAWEAARRGDSESSAPLMFVDGMAVGPGLPPPVQSTGAKRKRIRRSQRSKAKVVMTPEMERAAQADIEQLRAEGVLGANLLGAGGDVVGG